MKNRILSIILVIMMLIPCATMMVSAATPEDYYKTEVLSENEKYEQMTTYLSNDYMEFRIHPISGEIGIYNKKTNEIMLSNPVDVSGVGSDNGKKQYLSTIILKYKAISATVETIYYSYTDACIYGQMAIKDEDPNDNKVSVIYDLGKKEMVLPLVILDSDFQILFDRIRQTLGDEKKAESRINTIKLRYSYSEKDGIWIFNTFVSDKNKETLQKFFIQEALLTSDEMHSFYDNAGFNYLTGVLNYGSYNDYNVDVTYQPPFQVPVEYTLTNDGFTATVDMSKIVYDEETYNVMSVSILPYFNAAKRDEKGYAFLPDGGGVLIRYEDLYAAGSIDNIATPLYGMDYSIYTTTIKNQEQAIFPVFGNVITSREQKNGFFAIIESGDAHATITSANNEFNSIYPTFNISSSDKYDLADSFSGGSASSKEINVNGVQRYVGKATVKYAMLTPSNLSESGSASAKYDTSYIGMANYYRDYLQARGDLTKIDPSKLDRYSRIFLEVFGSLQIEEKIMTFPVKVNKALTTFTDVISMHKTLANYGVNNMTFILTGFANGGLENQYPTYLKWQKVLGGADGYNELIDYAEKNDVEIAPNVDFSYSKDLKSFSGFKYKKTASKTLDGRYASRREYDASIQMFQRKGGIVISTDSYDLAYSKFINSASEFKITSLATRAFGSDLSSDFDEKTGYIFREQSKVNTQNMLSKLSGKDTTSSTSFKLILDKGNAYSLRYASGLLKTPIDSSRRLNTSEAVPFVGMVLHGSIEFAGDAINMEGDERYMFLKALENGANLYFTIAMQNTELLKGTLDYNHYYSVQFKVWEDSIVRMYKEYNDVMSSKQSSYITEHEFLNADEGYNPIRTQDLIDNPDKTPTSLNDSRVVRVEYENGEGFILNYNSYEIQVEYDGVVYTIGALGYATYGA